MQETAVNSGLLLVAVTGLIFPAVLHYTRTEVHSGESELALSRFCSCIMIVAYEWSQTEESSNDDEGPEISKWESIIWLLIMTAWISILSEYLVHAIEGASIAWNVPLEFVRVVLLPIVGNATEHASAIMFAMKDKLIPFSVLIGWIPGQPMDLNFQLFETAMLFMTVLVVAFMLR
ncbi:vacuolar cation/proton exchanger 5, partial [Quercus suber]